LAIRIVAPALAAQDINRPAAVLAFTVLKVFEHAEIRRLHVYIIE
jgi:hypothetical protein